MTINTVYLPAPRDGSWNGGEQALFTYSLVPDPTSHISLDLHPRSGSIVTVIGRADDDADDSDPELSTIMQRGDAGALRVYTVRFGDGHESDAFEDELSEVDR
jgi:hypothetical protein